jgi:hypothetical protein
MLGDDKQDKLEEQAFMKVLDAKYGGISPSTCELIYPCAFSSKKSCTPPVKAVHFLHISD